MMKARLIYMLCMLATLSYAQVAIEKDNIDGSGIVDFKLNSNKGIVLPYVLQAPEDVPGSLLYDANKKKVLFYDGVEWKDLSRKEGMVDISKGHVDRGSKQGVIIGDDTQESGVLVLNDNKKALILPKNQEPWKNIKSPEAGTITYDLKNKVICIYNGKEWTFWGL